MPTYINETNRRITWRDLEWQPGHSKSIRRFIPHKIIGLTMTSDLPFVLRDNRDLGYVEMLITPDAPVEDRRYWLPFFDSIQLTVFVLKGSKVGLEIECEDEEELEDVDLVTMYVGDSAIPIVVDLNNYHHSVYSWEYSGYLTFESKHPAIVTIKVDPFTTRGTDRRGGD